MNIKIKNMFWYVLSGVLFLPSMVNANAGASSPTTLENPLKESTIIGMINLIIKDFIVPVGTVLVIIFIIYAGFLFIKAQGNPTKIEEAKKVLLYVVIGAAIILGANILSDVISGTVDTLKK